MLLVSSVASFYFAILSRLAGINQIMNNIQSLTFQIKGVKFGIQGINWFLVAGIAVSEASSVVCFDGSDFKLGHTD